MILPHRPFTSPSGLVKTIAGASLLNLTHTGIVQIGLHMLYS